MTQGQPSRARKLDDSGYQGLGDSLFLVLIVLLSVAPYAGRLGFYGDDWDFLARLTTAPDQSLAGLWNQQLEWTANLRMRPTQVALQALLYSAFRLEPLGYHLVNSMVLSLMAVLVYWVLRELGLPRVVAVSIPAVYALLPNYSTNRFWFAAFGYALSMAFFALGLYADLRAIRSRSAALVGWKLVALVSLVIAGFGYEVVIPLFFLAALVVWLCGRRLHVGGLVGRFGRGATTLLLGSNILVLALVVVYKASIAKGAAAPDVLHIVRLVAGPMFVNFGTYGIGLPYAVAWSIGNVSAAVVATGAAVFAVVFAKLTLLLERPSNRLPMTRTWAKLAAAGLVVFGLGYAMFVVTGRISFTSTGTANRVALVAALGFAMTMTALAGWVSNLPRRDTSRTRCFSAVVAALCLSGFLVINALAGSWADAWTRQQQVLEDIDETARRPPPNSTLLLHGVCPYVGPAIVFQTYWDLAGALQVMYNDATLRADVTSGDVSVRGKGISTFVYGPRFHRYGRRLLLFDHPAQTLYTVPNRQTALHLLGAQPGESSRCRRSAPGTGVEIFPFDRIYHELGRRLAALPNRLRTEIDRVGASDRVKRQTYGGNL